MKKKRFFLAILFLLLSKSALFASTSKGVVLPRNIIIMIGDGMGVGAISAYCLANTNSNFFRFKNIALMSTYADGSLVTDSAAGGTALATGFKTKNGYVSTLPDGTHLETIMEVAKKKGKSTGIVVTCSVTHATPATFYAHVSSRGNEAEIATFATNQTIDVFIGGGLSFFTPTPSQQTLTTQYTEANPGQQTINLLEIMSNLGYKIITNYEEFALYTPTKTEKLLALLESMHLPPALNTNRKTSLPEMTKKSLDILSKSKNGFVLMIEGSQIDWEAHGNNAKGLIAEMSDFDKTIGVVLDFAQKSGDTLVIVTSDHETGGVGIIGGVVGKSTTIRFLSKDHTGVLVPTFSYGPGSENFLGIIDNTFIGKKLIEILSGSSPNQTKN
ncbi:MAG: alkaline phosphatase [Brevinematia bacterium]